MNDYKRASEYFERTKHSRKEMMNAIHRAMAELDQEYLTLLEQLQQAQAKAERYEKALQEIVKYTGSDYTMVPYAIATKALEGKENE
jgi:ABC-type oligopeptide transport system substrate-binding subunit